MSGSKVSFLFLLFLLAVFLPSVSKVSTALQLVLAHLFW